MKYYISYYDSYFSVSLSVFNPFKVHLVVIMYSDLPLSQMIVIANCANWRTRKMNNPSEKEVAWTEK